MIVTSKISVDLTRANIGARVNAVQGDGNTRSVEITLLSDGRPWTPPDGVDVAIAYYRPGGTKGLYNLLADGTQAITISGNVATIILAPQMLTASGTVQASLVFNDAQLNRLTTFPFSVSVASNPAAGAQKTEDYLRLQWLEDKLEKYLAALKASGVFDGKPGDNGVTFTPSVSENGDLSWSNDGGRPNPPTVNIKGPKPVNGVDYGTPEEIAGIAQQAAEVLRPDLSQIKDDLSDKLTAPDSGIEVGKYFRVASIDENGKVVLEACDIPVATMQNPGIMRPADGLGVLPSGAVYVSGAGNKEIDARLSNNVAITPRYLPYAVKSSMSAPISDTDPEWTAEEQAAARYRLGLTGDYELIEQITITEDNASIVRDTEPDGTPYHFRMIAIVGISPIMSDNRNMDIMLYKSDGSRIAYIDSVKYAHAGSQCYWQVWLLPMANGVKPFYASSYNPNAKEQMQCNLSIITDPIAKINMLFNNGGAISGTSIKIYGVRA